MKKRQARFNGRWKGIMVTIKLTKAQHEVVKTALVELDARDFWTNRDYNTLKRACYQIWNPEEDKLKKIKKILEKA